MLHLVYLWEDKEDNTIPLRCRASIVGLKSQSGEVAWHAS